MPQQMLAQNTRSFNKIKVNLQILTPEGKSRGHLI